MILAAMLFVLELTAPGIFFMWFGAGRRRDRRSSRSATTSAGNGSSSGSARCRWRRVLVAVKYLRKHPLESERPLLNERATQLIGQTFDLIDPIVNGRGSVKIGDFDLAGGGT